VSYQLTVTLKWQAYCKRGACVLGKGAVQVEIHHQLVEVNGTRVRELVCCNDDKGRTDVDKQRQRRSSRSTADDSGVVLMHLSECTD